MTVLWLLAIACLAAGGAAQAARRNTPARRAFRAHHRMVDTLDAITRQAVAHPVRERDADEVHTHVRLLRADAPDTPSPTTIPHLGRIPVSPHSGEGGGRPAVPAEPPVGPSSDAPTVGHRSTPPPAERRQDGPAAAAPLMPDKVAALAAYGRRRSGPSGSRRPRSARPGRRQGRHESPNWRSPRILGTVLGAAGAVTVVAVVVVALGGGHPTPRTRRLSALPPTTLPTRASTPPTTAPAAPATLQTSTSSVSTYRLSGPAVITLTATTGVSWVELRQGNESGPVVYEGRLGEGQSETVNGSAWVRLGNPTAVTVAVNQIPIHAPSLTAGEPYNLQFG